MKRFSSFLFLTVVLALFLPASGENRTIQVGDTTRQYIIEVPSNYDGSTAYGIIMVFHGLTGTAEGTASYTGFHDYGDQDGFITIYPQGLLIDSPLNPGTQEFGWVFDITDNRDVTFVTVLLDSLIAEFNIDENKIYSTGISNGGFFSDLLGCQIGDRLTAIAPVIGGTPLSAYGAMCPVTKALPALHLGTEHDGIVDISSLRDATSFWVSHNGCNPTPTQEGMCQNYTGCTDGAEVVHCEFTCLIDGQPATAPDLACHTWPMSYTGYDFETTDLILEFFRRHGLSGQPVAVEFVIPPDFNLSSTNSMVHLEVYDLQGRLLARFSEVNISSWKLDALKWIRGREALPEGWYVLQLTIGERIRIRQKALLK
jgi:polyhydroxybutyrate depolymerase